MCLVYERNKEVSVAEGSRGENNKMGEVMGVGADGGGYGGHFRKSGFDSE